jgi:hypothetical protein
VLDPDLQKLTHQPPDHSLERLEVDIWMGVNARAQSARITRRLLVCQAIVLLAGIVGSLMAGEHWGSSRHAIGLEVFSSHMPLSPPTLLLGNGS